MASANEQRRSLGLRLLPAAVILFVLALVVSEFVCDDGGLSAYRKSLIARGERLEVPTDRAPADAIAFSNVLYHVVDAMPPDISRFAGMISGRIEKTNGQCARGSQQLAPSGLGLPASATWKEVCAVVDAAKPALDYLDVILTTPPRCSAVSMRDCLEKDTFQNFSSMRRTAQALHLAAITELHRGNRILALRHIQALAGCARIAENETTLVNYMVRIAIVGLLYDVCWDALHEESWTDRELATFQDLFPVEHAFGQIPLLLENERIGRLYTLHKFRDTRYRDWVVHWKEMYTSFGMTVPAAELAKKRRLWRDHAFHPLWRFAWAGQEELLYLKFSQAEIEAARDAITRFSWLTMQQKHQQLRNSLQPAWNDWRFYNNIPFMDSTSVLVGKPPPATPCPYPDYSRALSKTLENLTAQHLLQTVAALKRYRLRTGSFPDRLEMLAPSCRTSPPRDLVDGALLRYQLISPTQFQLYSVGEDGVDDHCNPSASSGNPKDWVWKN